MHPPSFLPTTIQSRFLSPYIPPLFCQLPVALSNPVGNLKCTTCQGNTLHWGISIRPPSEGPINSPPSSMGRVIAGSYFSIKFYS